MTESPYDWQEHEPDCRCPSCNVVVPFRRPAKPGVPPHIKAELARLKATWAAQRAAEAKERRSLAEQLADFDRLLEQARARKAQEQAEAEKEQHDQT